MAATFLPENALNPRVLYRAAEARTARLQILAEAGQTLSAVAPEAVLSV